MMFSCKNTGTAGSALEGRPELGRRMRSIATIGVCLAQTLGPSTAPFKAFEPVDFTQGIKIKSRQFQGVFGVENGVEGFDLDQWAAGAAFQGFWSRHKRASQTNGADLHQGKRKKDNLTPQGVDLHMGWWADQDREKGGMNMHEPTASHSHF